MTDTNKKIKVEMIKVSPIDLEELAATITGINYDHPEYRSSEVEEILNDRFKIDIETLTDIVARLLPLIHVAKSPLTGTVYKGFADINNGTWILKTQIT